jgi:hypothetical protein
MQSSALEGGSLRPESRRIHQSEVRREAPPCKGIFRFSISFEGARQVEFLSSFSDSQATEEYGRSIFLVSTLGGYGGYRIGRRKKHSLAGVILGAMLGAIGWTIIALALFVA